ncbi:TetR/AcrR family transcriptional regulator [Glycomyces xiaoerkulensis]|uniref:TetR/AcrR family transcriptional regulator n=1 Tax=Glycomyces xiaoerkulensis TaxID=2038139 RepID=UPI000C2697DD|nr:TetR/AcrR family transcriptional regulator [Glycomyces xiaoerkulensis]
MTADTAPRMTPAARRVLDTASELFYHRGINAVGVDLIAETSGVTKKTIYDRFGSKDHLVMAYLRERDGRWRALVEHHIGAAGPGEAVPAVFDALKEWTAASGDRGCALINARAEITGPNHPVRTLAAEEKQWLLGRFTGLLRAEGAADPDADAVELLLLHEGAVVMNDVGQVTGAIDRARLAARRLVDRA